jgi:hypothetical protein
MQLFFDRGTIVIESGAPAGVMLPVYFRWDARVGRWRAPGLRLPVFRGWLSERGIAYHPGVERVETIHRDRLSPLAAATALSEDGARFHQIRST